MSGVYGGSANGVTSPSVVRAVKGLQKTSLSNTVETTIITAGAANVVNDLYGLICANTGATASKVDIRDQTGGVIRATLEVPAGDTRGFMLPAASSADQSSAAQNWTAQLGTSTTMEITALFVINTPP